jgi:hypothetical protein
MIKKTLYPMLVKCHEHLCPLVRLNKNLPDQNIFEQIVSTSEITKEIAKRELLIFRRYQLDVKTSNVLFNDGKNMKQCFLWLEFLAL